MLTAVVSTGTSHPAVLVVFILTYLGLAKGQVPGLKLDRTGIAMLGAIAMMIFDRQSTTAIMGYINWPTVLLLFSFFVISAQLRLSGFFETVATGISVRLGHPVRFLLVLMLVTAGLSAFLNHDIVCFVFTPIVASALLKRRMNPVPFLVALAISSNIGAAATIIGNAQDMMIAEVAGLGFGRYLLWCLVPVTFAFAGTFAILWALSRGQLGPAGKGPAESGTPAIPFNRAHTIKGLVILGVVIGLFFSPLPKEIVALIAAGIHLASPKFRTSELLGLVEWPILVLFMSLFIVTGTFQTTPYGELGVQALAHVGINLQAAPVLALVTAVLSNLINNSAAVMLLIKVAHVVRPPGAYVLALANSLGGSLLVVGSVANIIVVQQARDLGVTISFRDFARLGVPVTLVALAGLVGWVALMT